MAIKERELRSLKQSVFTQVHQFEHINMSEQLSDKQLKELEFNKRQNTRLTRDSQAVVKLIEGFTNGSISVTSEPKTVWLSDPVFTAHKLNNFRTCFNNIRKEFQDQKASPVGNLFNFIFFFP